MKFIYNIILLILVSISSIFAKSNLNIIHPNGGESFYSGEETDIFWTEAGQNGSVSVEFTSDNGKTWDYLNNNVKSFFYSWDIPNVSSDSCKIRISQLTSDEAKPNIEWEKTYGGTNVEQYPLIKPTKDGGYIIFSESLSDDGDVGKNNGNIDYWLLKIDSVGTIEWSKVYGGQHTDYASWVEETPDGGYIIVGSTSSDDGDVGPRDAIWSDVWVLKLDKNGNIEWKKTYGGSDSDFAIGVVVTEDNGYIVSGYSESKDGNVPKNRGSRDIWVFKINALGNVVWSRTYGGTEIDQSTTMDKTKDGGVIIAGRTRSDFGGMDYNRGGWDYFVLKLDSKGLQQWLKIYGGEDSDTPKSIIELENGGYVVAGYSYSEYVDGGFNKGDADAWVMRLRSDGSIYWSQMYGGSYTDMISSVCETADGGLIVGGFSTSDDGDVEYNGGEEDYWIMKLGDFGELLWSETYGEESIARLNSVEETRDGGFIAAGMRYYQDADGNYNETITDIWVMKMQPAFASIQSDVSDSVFSISKRNLKSNIDYINMGEVSVNSKKDTLFTSAICNVTNERIYINSVVMKDDIYDEFTIEFMNGRDYLESGECADLKFRYKPKELGEKYVSAEFNTSSGKFRDAIYLYGISSDVVEKKSFAFNLVPNVSSTNINVRIYFEKDENATLEIFDTQGRMIEVLYSGIVNEGFLELNINLEKYKSAQYYLQLITPTLSRIEKFVVIK